MGSEIKEESKTIEEIDEIKDDGEIEEEEEERTRTVVGTERKKWSEKAWPIMKNVVVQIGIQLGVALLGVLIFQFVSSRFT